MLRDFLDEILDFIGSESLTDEEYDSLPEGLTESYDRDAYDALKDVLISRETISSQGKKLKAYFRAKGVDLSDVTLPVPNSNIFVGSGL